MRGPTTRPRGDANLSSRLGRTDDTVDILARRIARRNSAAKTTGAGTYGTTILTAAAPNVVVAGSQYTVSPGGWDIEAMDWLGGTPPDVTINTLPGFPDGAFSLDEPGLYSMRVNLGGVFTGSLPSMFRGHVNPSPQDVQNDEIASIRTQAFAVNTDGDFQWTEFVGPFVAIGGVPSFAVLFAWWDAAPTVTSLRMTVHVTRVA